MQTGDIIDEIVDFVLAILPGSNADVAQLVEQRFRKPSLEQDRFVSCRFVAVYWAFLPFAFAAPDIRRFDGFALT